MNNLPDRPQSGAMPPKHTRAYEQRRYFTCRANLFVVTAFSLLHLVLLALGSDFSLSFAAILPLVVYTFGKGAAAQYGMPALFPVAVFLVGLLILFYFLCWLFSKKRYGWLIPALVCYGIDTLVLLSTISPEYLVSMIIEIVFHAWVL
ncbi:MAG: hypothetical protein IJR89_08380 [Clostridia bacterium]|nr:hypothetical protein [Clostridia bacterium]